MQVEQISVIKITKDDGTAEYQVTGSVNMFQGLQLLAEALYATAQKGAADDKR